VDDRQSGAAIPAERAGTPAGAVTPEIPLQNADSDVTQQLLADADRRSTSSRGEVSVVDVEYTDSDGTVLDDALSDLASLDRRTSSELQGLRADRDQRIGTHDDGEAVLEAMHDRGLDETIRELFGQFPPEERRDVQATTGHRLDLSAVARSAGGRLPNDGLFAQRRRTETGERCLGVAIDLSGSMDGFEAKLALAALASAADLLGDEFVAAGFRRGDRSTPLVTGPNEPFDPEHLSSVGTGGGTPLAAGIRETRRLVKAANANERVLLVVTDGAPNVGLPDGSGAMSDTRSQIERCRRDGVAVVGIGVDASDRMADLFGDDSYVEVEDREFADRLLDVYRTQLRRTRRY
jgi:Mg-chelatase subunit ChlD